MKAVRPYLRLLRACVKAEMSLRETVSVFVAVKRGHWEARTNREMLAQANYFRMLSESRGPSR